MRTMTVSINKLVFSLILLLQRKKKSLKSLKKKILDKLNFKSPKQRKYDKNGVPCSIKKQSGVPQMQLKSGRIVKEAEKYILDDEEDSNDVITKEEKREGED